MSNYGYDLTNMPNNAQSVLKLNMIVRITTNELQSFLYSPYNRLGAFNNDVLRNVGLIIETKQLPISLQMI